MLTLRFIYSVWGENTVPMEEEECLSIMTSWFPLFWCFAPNMMSKVSQFPEGIAISLTRKTTKQ